MGYGQKLVEFEQLLLLLLDLFGHDVGFKLLYRNLLAFANHLQAKLIQLMLQLPGFRH